ncbi:MAG TPA: hypothetical protein VJI32_04550 [Candidatus Nanoarchaeia archaeon]|nr:hypothetical protein [Candidatus Nanoarchaeia archaeon]
MKYLHHSIKASKEVYSSPSYYTITIFSALVLVGLNVVLRNYSLLFDQFSFSLLLSLIYGLLSTFTPLALLFLAITSLLGGMVIALSIFLIRRQLAMQASVGAPSILIAILAPACPSCALGLLGLLGISGVLAFLPLKGFEFAILGIILLLISIGYLSSKIVLTVCEVTS